MSFHAILPATMSKTKASAPLVGRLRAAALVDHGLVLFHALAIVLHCFRAAVVYEMARDWPRTEQKLTRAAQLASLVLKAAARDQVRARDINAHLGEVLDRLRAWKLAG